MTTQQIKAQQIEAQQIEAQRIAKTNAMLAALETAPNYSEYMTAFVALEKRLYGLPGMGVAEADRAWAEFARIQKAQRACMFSGRPVTLDDVAALICGAVTASTRLDSVHMEAAE